MYSHFMAEKTIVVSDLTEDVIQDSERLSLELVTTSSMLFNQPVKAAELKVHFKGMFIKSITVNPNSGWMLDFNLSEFASLYEQKMKEYDRRFDDVD